METTKRKVVMITKMRHKTEMSAFVFSAFFKSTRLLAKMKRLLTELELKTKSCESPTDLELRQQWCNKISFEIVVWRNIISFEIVFWRNKLASRSLLGDEKLASRSLKLSFEITKI